MKLPDNDLCCRGSRSVFSDRERGKGNLNLFMLHTHWTALTWIFEPMYSKHVEATRLADQAFLKNDLRLPDAFGFAAALLPLDLAAAGLAGALLVDAEFATIFLVAGKTERRQ